MDTFVSFDTATWVATTALWLIGIAMVVVVTVVVVDALGIVDLLSSLGHFYPYQRSQEYDAAVRVAYGAIRGRGHYCC